MILSFTQALSHGFESFMASEWIWVIFRFLQQLKKSFPGCVWPTERMWCCFSHCDQSLVPSKEDVIFFFFFALKLLVPTSVLSTVGGYHYVPVALTGDISQCLKQPRISNSKCISPNLASHFITTIAWLRKTNKFRTGLVLAKSWCTTPIPPPTHTNGGLLLLPPAVTVTPFIGAGTPSCSSHSVLLIFYASFRIVTVLIRLAEAEKHAMGMRVSTGRKERHKF